MIKYTNECVQCAVPGYPCMGSVCPNINVPHYYCDLCGKEGAKHKIDGDDYCEECIKEYMQEAFDSLAIFEKAALLGIIYQENYS